MEHGNKLLTPGTVLGILGMLGAIATAWNALDRRITQIEERQSASIERYNEIRTDIKEIKDYLIKRGTS